MGSRPCPRWPASLGGAREGSSSLGSRRHRQLLLGPLGQDGGQAGLEVAR